MTPENILYALATMVVTAIIGFWFGKARDRSNKEDEELAKVVKEVEALKVTAVSESRVREIIKDAIEPTGADVKEIKAAMLELGKTLQDIQLKLATEIAFKRGKGQRDE